jgi:hypothetical protein
MKSLIFYLPPIAVMMLSLTTAYGQSSNINPTAKTVTYEELYDSPYDISKLFIHLQPVYGELFATNPTAGLGVEAQYYLRNILDIKGHVRVPYASRTDVVRHAAERNSTVLNDPKGYFYAEVIGSYHIVDKEVDTETKFILYSSRYRGEKWAATVPLYTKIPTKVRKVYSARLGGLSYTTAVDYNRLADLQGIALADGDGNPIPDGESVFGNMRAQGAYIGTSLALIKNAAVQPDKIYGTLVNDLIFTAFLDIILTPAVRVDDIYLNDVVYSASTIKKSLFGLRAGFDGKFNREIGWAYAAEMGYRPGLANSGFYVSVRMSFPVFSSSLQHQVESFGK